MTLSDERIKALADELWDTSLRTNMPISKAEVRTVIALALAEAGQAERQSLTATEIESICSALEDLYPDAPSVGAQLIGAIKQAERPDPFTSLDDPVQTIIDKCEQLWNESGICDAEFHAVLGFIHQQARRLQERPDPQLIIKMSPQELREWYGVMTGVWERQQYETDREEGVECCELAAAIAKNREDREAAPDPPPDGKTYARHQPCGCVVCICDHPERCLGCGAKRCGKDECCINGTGQPVYDSPDPPDIAELIERLEKRVKIASRLNYKYEHSVGHGTDDCQPGYDAELDLRAASALRRLSESEAKRTGRIDAALVDEIDTAYEHVRQILLFGQMRKTHDLAVEDSFIIDDTSVVAEAEEALAAHEAGKGKK